jgi:hypothetical protein
MIIGYSYKSITLKKVSMNGRQIAAYTRYEK